MASEASYAHKLALRWRDKFSSLPNGPSYGPITSMLTRQLEFFVSMTHPDTLYTHLPPMLKFLQDEVDLASDIKPSQKIDNDMLTVLTMVTGVSEVFLASMIRMVDISVLAIQAQEEAGEITIDDVMDAAPKEEVGDECDVKPDVENIEDMSVEQLEQWGKGFLESMEVAEIWDPTPVPQEEVEESRPRTVIKTEPMGARKSEAALHKVHDKISKRNGLRTVKNEIMDDDQEEVIDFKQIKSRRPRKIKNEVVDDDEEEVMVSKTVQKRAHPRKIKNEVVDDDDGLDGRPLIPHSKKVKNETVDDDGELDGRPLIPHRLVTLRSTRKVKTEPTDDHEIRTSSRTIKKTEKALALVKVKNEVVENDGELDGRPLIPHSKKVTLGRKVKTEPIDADEIRTSSRTVKKTNKALALVKVKREPLSCVVTGADCFICKKRVLRTLRGFTVHLSNHKVVLRTSDYYLVCSCGKEVYATMEARNHQDQCDQVGSYHVACKNRFSMNG